MSDFDRRPCHGINPKRHSNSMITTKAMPAQRVVDRFMTSLATSGLLRKTSALALLGADTSYVPNSIEAERPLANIN